MNEEEAKKIKKPGKPRKSRKSTTQALRDISPDDLKKIEMMGGLGMSVKQISLIMGVAKSTFEDIWKENDAIYQALKRGRAAANMNVASTAFKMAKSGRNALMTKYWLNCRANWKETTKLEHTGRDGAHLSAESAFASRVSNMSDDELAEFIASKKALNEEI